MVSTVRRTMLLTDTRGNRHCQMSPDKSCRVLPSIFDFMILYGSDQTQTGHASDENCNMFEEVFALDCVHTLSYTERNASTRPQGVGVRSLQQQSSCSLKQQMLVRQQITETTFPKNVRNLNRGLNYVFFFSLPQMYSLKRSDSELQPSALSPGRLSLPPSCVIAGCHLHFLLEHL